MKKQLLGVILVLFVGLIGFPVPISAAETSVFSPPAVTELAVTYPVNGVNRTAVLFPEREQIALPMGSKPVFTVRFDSIQRLGRVYITSTRDDGVKYLEAFPSGGDSYVTNGWFDADDTAYLPGTIGVVYTNPMIAVTTSGATASDINMADIRTELEARGVSIEGDIGDDGSFCGTVTLEERLTEFDEMHIDLLVSRLCNIDELDDYEINDWMGSYYDFPDERDCSSLSLIGADGGSYILYMHEKEWENTASYLILVHNTTEHSFTRLLFTLADYEPGEIADVLGQTDFICSLLNDCGIFAGVDALDSGVYGSSLMDAEQRAQATKRIDLLRRDKRIITLGVTCMPLLADSEMPLKDISMADASALLFSSLLGGLTSSSDYFWQYQIGLKQGCAPIEGVFSIGDESADCTHSYSSVVTAPTCTGQGFTTYTCNQCGETYIDDYTGALGHRFFLR